MDPASPLLKTALGQIVGHYDDDQRQKLTARSPHSTAADTMAHDESSCGITISNLLFRRCWPLPVRFADPGQDLAKSYWEAPARLP